MKERIFQAANLISVALGLVLGFLLRLQVPLTPHQIHWIQTPGEIFLNMLQIFAVPLIVTSVIAGVTELSNKMSKKMAIFTGTYICGTTFIAISIGMTLVLMAKPGEGQDISSTESPDVPAFSIHLVLQDLLRNMIPESFLQAFYEQYKTEIVLIKREESVRNISQNDTEIRLIGSYVAGPNMIGLIVWSFVIGIMLNKVESKANVTVQVIQCLNEAIKITFNWILWYLPVGVLFLVTHQVLEVQDWGAIIKLGKLSGLVLLGYLIHALFVLPGLYFIILRVNPYVVFKKTSRALLTAFVIASSSATLPITLQCCEENVKVNVRLCRLMLPIATTINKNGTALYEVIAVVFITQINNIVLDVGQIITIGLTVSIISFGTAGIPVTGAMITILILTSAGLPADDAYVLLVVEWLLDHFGTSVNVLGDCFGVAVINHLCYDDLMKSNNKSIARTRSIKDIEMDLSFLDSDEEFISSTPSSHSRSISPKRGDHLRRVVTPPS
ncbi:excitatory amino acid transporter 3-like isoform X1 [Xiphophorus couchianus]|uniref:excitatory amino acid transporter 3-like isoform X1 n=2 Tax=Xiphophorus couchianus TaxID=32473 RepID=UPI001016BE8A|nr:excitatory amino acid transporter 3-like isoform X1 [Xiphophorus couchianus]